MKRRVKNLSDVDQHGRIRRHPVVEDNRPMITAKFLDGPLGGTEQQVRRGQDYVKVGMWWYSWAGKEGRTPLFCKMPKSRAERRILMFIIGKRGADPRVDMAQMKRQPVKGVRDKHAQGARRRALARKLRTEQAAWRASDGYNGA